MLEYDKFKCVQEHSADLALIINQLGYEDVHNWLMIASGIKSVDFNWNRFDKTGAGWCRPAYEYDVAKSKITQLYLNELTVFNYIWGGFESLLSKMYSKSQIKKKGKVNLCVEKFEDLKKFPVLKYEVLKKQFFALFKSSLEKKLIEYKKDIPKEEIRIIYNIRNKFAHGDLEFPEDMEYNGNLIYPTNLIKLINYSSRVVICHIQSLIFLSNRNNTVYSYLSELFTNVDIDDYGDDLFQVDFILPRLHLKEIDKNEIP
ncbi:hypothetical protein [Croceivirga sp. JEA036]|uniref:hypothetical protein n=1 Tax=Croceivirga sp. JEA036 TaxID=2721162 RepID=UPI00143C3DEB|nr:hypothetical protein [Croceivirga sp. JEA036]NJB35321.1 hypothetical protein [Croceivirga sp. JEA036]